MTSDDSTDHPEQRSQLFTLRLWPEELGAGQIDWRGKVQHVNSGEARYFRDWPTLQAFVEALLRGAVVDGTGTDGAEAIPRRQDRIGK